MVAVPGSRPHPRHPPARPGTGTFPGPIPGTAVAVLVLVAASAVGLVRSRAGGRSERGRRGPRLHSAIAYGCLVFPSAFHSKKASAGTKQRRDL